MSNSRKRRAKKLRRQNKQALKFGQKAKPVHKSPSGRTGSIFEVYWAITEDYLRHCPEAKKYCDDPKSHPDFAAMISAKLALKEANKQHGIAYRRLLSIGVKRGGK